MFEYDEMSSRPPAWYPALENHLRHERHAEATRAVEDVLARCRESGPPGNTDTAEALRAVAMLQLWDRDEAATKVRGVACAEEALALSRGAADVSGEAAALHLLAKFRMGAGDLAEALRLAEDALARCRTLQDRAAEGYVTNTLARIRIARDEAQEATHLATEALALFEDLDDVRGRISVLQTLFRLHIASDDGWQAIIVLDELVELHRHLGDAVGEATANLFSAQYHADVGSPQESVSRAQKAAEMFKHEGLDKMHGSALLCVASALVSLGQFDSGQATLTEVMAVFRRIDDIAGQGAASSTLANSHLMQEEFRKAANRFEDAATFYGQAGDKAAKANALREKASCLGKMLLNESEVPEGGWWPEVVEEPLRAAKASVSLFGEVQEIDGEAYAFALQQLSNCYLISREFSEAIARGQESLSIFERKGNYHGAAAAYGSLAQAFSLKGEATEGVRLAKEGLKFARRATDQHQIEFLEMLIERYIEAAEKQQFDATRKSSTGARGEGASTNSLYRNGEAVAIYSAFQPRVAKAPPPQKPRQEESVRAPRQDGAKIVYRARVVGSPGIEPQIKTITRPSERRAKKLAESMGLAASEAGPGFEPDDASSSRTPIPTDG